MYVYMNIMDVCLQMTAAAVERQARGMNLSAGRMKERRPMKRPGTALTAQVQGHTSRGIPLEGALSHDPPEKRPRESSEEEQSFFGMPLYIYSRTV